MSAISPLRNVSPLRDKEELKECPHIPVEVYEVFRPFEWYDLFLPSKVFYPDLDRLEGKLDKGNDIAENKLLQYDVKNLTEADSLEVSKLKKELRIMREYYILIDGAKKYIRNNYENPSTVIMWD